ncbi:MAG TPA: hypothetical protein PLR52_06005 [Bacteroidales bacterium]|nr:hypothetical protein [Bacteroidales bacterium]HPR73743.1 hypothetical protein [Bacteroidales bacterium]
MTKKTYFLCILFFSIFINNTPVNALNNNSSLFQANTRLSFYSHEKEGELLLHVPRGFEYRTLSVILKVKSDTIGTWQGIPRQNLIRIPFIIDLQPAFYTIHTHITAPGNDQYLSECELNILKYKPNEVKADRLTGGLIVNRKPFIPFGFYCYSPVDPFLPEEEVVKGFNTISPYQKILPETFHERKAYMDRCAELGMKVHYNILSVSGGGGVNSVIEGLTVEEKKELLEFEIKSFRDHPALLAWYIADEPNGYGIPPDSLEKIYTTIKEIDPWHPVSMVFMAPFLSSRNYINALDIVMADPYPVPDMPISLVGNTAASLSREFYGKRPLWMVPQAFGGGELWKREPTLQELRSMTYQAIINGARGIQYFVRQGLNIFPKSTVAWNECGRMAVEISEISPWLLSDENTIPVRSASSNIAVTSALHKGQLLVLAVNKTNKPVKAGISLGSAISGRARVIFENRSLPVSSGYLSDDISAYGSQAYMITIKLPKDTVKRWKDNLFIDPGFEDISGPGVPSACYAWNNGDKGATYFSDTRENFEGNHSIRLVTPKENKSIRLRFFPVPVMAGRTYIISIRAKSDPDKPGYFDISLGGYGKKRFKTTGEWKEYISTVTLPYSTEDFPPKANIVLEMPSPGTGWFDMLQITEAVDIRQSMHPEQKKPWEGLWDGKNY